MNTLTAHRALHEPLTTDAAIEDRTLNLIGTAGSRQLWLMMLDAHDQQLPVVIPLDDLPRLPNTASTDALIGRAAAILAQAGGCQLVLVWERPGRGRLLPHDTAWARAVAENCARRGLRLRAQLLSHTRGVALLAPADYAAAPTPLTPTGVSSTGGTEC